MHDHRPTVVGRGQSTSYDTEEDLRTPKKWTDNITEWTDVTLCVAVRLSAVTTHKIVQHKARLYLIQRFLTKGHEEEEDSSVRMSVTKCIVAKRYVLQQKRLN